MAKGNFGERLKRERDMREVSMDELIRATRISRRFVEALENEDWEKLPGGVFGHGFVRTIARYLGLDEEALLSEYDLARKDKLQPEPPKPEERIPSPPKWVPFAVLFGVLLVVVCLFYAAQYGWRHLSARRAARSASASPPVPAPVAVPASADTNSAVPASKAPNVKPAAAPNSRLDLSVSTSAATRVRVVADDKVLLDRRLPAGETRHFSARLQFRVTVGDSSAVLLELNGQAMPPLGAPGASGTMVLSHKDLRQASRGTSQP